jgi:TolB-like protein/DNA-binding winged helix-turn-helix (wHTH) protein/Tfp pilus assembly protein PilF
VETTRTIFRFGLFELDADSGELRKQGLKIRLPDQPLQILLLLLERPGQVITREALRQRLWPADTFVDFNAGLNSAIKKLRDALGDPAENSRFVETLPRRGYRFIAPLQRPTALRPDEAPAEDVAEPTKRVRWWIWTNTMAVTALAGILIWLGVSAWRQRQPSALAEVPVVIRSVVVLPFENLTGDPEQDYFAAGMTDALTTNLAQIHALRVISRTSAEQYKGAKKSLPAIARELEVDAVVEGAVVQSGNRVRVSAQLIHAATDRHLWAQSYERELPDVVVMQGEVATAIARAVQIEVRPEEQRRLARARVVQPDAYEAYLKGRFFWSKAQVRKAIDQFQQAIEKDPAFAAAYSGLSDAYRMVELQGVPPQESMPKAEDAARKALALDETLAEAHTSLAGVLYRYHWDWAGAEGEFRRSLELDPNYAEGHRAYAMFLLMLRRPEEALGEARRARVLSPLDEEINNELGTALTRTGRYDEAKKQLQQTLEINPKSVRAYAGLAEVYARQGDWARAAATYEEGRPGATAPWLGYMYALSGRRRDALNVLAAIEKRSHQRYVPSQNLAIVHVGLGDKDLALSALEKAYEERAFEVSGFPLLYEVLRDEPRYRQLLSRMGLAAQKGYLSR